MNSNINASQKTEIDNFLEIANYFTGSKAILFSYSPSFSLLYLAVKNKDRYFLLKFCCVRYIKVADEWIFGGLELDLQEDITGYYSGYKFFDRNYFEVICDSSYIIEIVNGQDILRL
jgi:hypothetical protein